VILGVLIEEPAILDPEVKIPIPAPMIEIVIAMAIPQ
jgi:hypothetical protein